MSARTVQQESFGMEVNKGIKTKWCIICPSKKIPGILLDVPWLDHEGKAVAMGMSANEGYPRIVDLN